MNEEEHLNIKNFTLRLDIKDVQKVYSNTELQEHLKEELKILITLKENKISSQNSITGTLLTWMLERCQELIRKPKDFYDETDIKHGYIILKYTDVLVNNR